MRRSRAKLSWCQQLHCTGQWVCLWCDEPCHNTCALLLAFTHSRLALVPRLHVAKTGRWHCERHFLAAIARKGKSGSHRHTVYWWNLRPRRAMITVRARLQVSVCSSCDLFHTHSHVQTAFDQLSWKPYFSLLAKIISRPQIYNQLYLPFLDVFTLLHQTYIKRLFV